MIDRLSWVTDMSTHGFGLVDGFKFNGRHCKEFNVWYVPDENNRWQDGEFFELFTEETPGKAGAYYWGNRTKTREFTLQCFFENIDRHIYNKMLRWLDKDILGYLEFDSKPNIKYSVRVTNRITPKVYQSVPCYESNSTLYSGTFTINMSAFYPYGVMDFVSVDEDSQMDLNNGFLFYETGMILTRMMPPMDISNTTIGASRSILLYNPGSEITPVTIYLEGTLTNNRPLVIYNKTTDQMCRIPVMPTSGMLKIDSEKGRVTNVVGGIETLAFVYHDEEYLSLRGSSPVDRGLTFMLYTGRREAKCNYGLRTDMEGKYIYVNSTLGWKKIISVTDPVTFTIDFTPTATSTFISDVVEMNELVVTGYSGLKMSTFRFEYLPHFK